MEEDIKEYNKEIEILTELQKQYSFDLNEFTTWREQLDSRKTFWGKFGQRFGQFTAILFINKFYNGCYNVIYPPQSIEWARKNVYVKILLILTGSWKEEDELYWIIIEQYATALIMGILISLNTKSFMRNLLTSLKRILSETSLIKTSYNTNILIFTFVRHLYFLTLNSCSALTIFRQYCS